MNEQELAFWRRARAAIEETKPVPPRSVLRGPKLARRSRSNTAEVGPQSGRLACWVPAVVYDHLADAADARSIDISRLLWVLATGLYRARIGPCPKKGKPGGKTLRMTVHAEDLRPIKRTLGRTGSRQVEIIPFAVELALQNDGNPDAPFLLTWEEELVMCTAGTACDLAELYNPLLLPALDQHCAALRERLGRHGLRPLDHERHNGLIRALSRLEGQILLAIPPIQRDLYWRDIVRTIAQLANHGEGT